MLFEEAFTPLGIMDKEFTMPILRLCTGGLLHTLQNLLYTCVSVRQIITPKVQILFLLVPDNLYFFIFLPAKELYFHLIMGLIVDDPKKINHMIDACKASTSLYIENGNEFDWVVL